MEKSRGDIEALMAIGEFLAAGYLEEPDASPMRRWSRAVRRDLENRSPLPYDGGLLYPCGPLHPGERLPFAQPPRHENRILSPSYSFTWSYNEQALRQVLDAEEDPAIRRALETLRRAMEGEHARLHVGHTPHTVGGWGYTHSIPHFGRVLREGLDEHARRVEAGLAEASASGDAAKADFYVGLQDVLEGVRRWCARLAEYLQAWPTERGDAARNRDRLVQALSRVPFEPARSFFEAVVAYNLVYYLDGCDNPGRFDQELQPYYERDRDAGVLAYEDAAALIAALAEGVRVNRGWSAAIGGNAPDGRPAYNDVTRMALEAAQRRFRPSLELRVRPDMPDAIWDAALDALATGAGNPALYNEPLYLDSLLQADLGLTPEDATWWNGGGCTETMVHGRSNVGSLEAGLNVPLVLQGSLRRHLPEAPTFEAFLTAFQADVAATIAEVVALVNRNQEVKARYRPQPLRSLLIDDCIERGVEYNAGGARYNWSVVNIAGIPDTIDSLAAVREAVFEKRELTGAEMVALLDADFAGAEGTRLRLAQCPRFGNDDPAADGLGADFTRFLFEEFRRHRPWRGSRFLPSCIQFVTYESAGAPVGATPDGRRAGRPLADSIGPASGRDTHGPTAMLRSVARLPLHLATGTPVLNMRFTKELFRTPEGRAQVRGLVEGFFRLGGMQVQLSVVSREELEDAILHPERHTDLVVRVGGYAEYFNNLSPELKRTVLERTEYAPGA